LKTQYFALAIVFSAIEIAIVGGVYYYSGQQPASSPSISPTPTKESTPTPTSQSPTPSQISTSTPNSHTKFRADPNTNTKSHPDAHNYSFTNSQFDNFNNHSPATHTNSNFNSVTH
jgi:hypothetical protein